MIVFRLKSLTRVSKSKTIAAIVHSIISYPMYRTALLICVLLFPVLTYAQVAQQLTADYIIVDKRSDDSSIDMDRGQVSYNLDSNEIKYESRNPARSAVINTNEVKIDLTDEGQVDISSMKFFNEYTVLHYILFPKKMDNGMSKLGFETATVNNDEDGIYIEWAPNQEYENVISIVHTKLKNTRLDITEYFSVDGSLLSEIIYVEHENINGRLVPVKVKTRYHQEGISYDRMLKLSNIRFESL